MYVYATEMVASYYRRLELNGKRILTITGSGDQVLNALFYGAKEVTGFDINRNALFMTELKLSAIRSLSYQEFLRFFSQTTNGFNYALYTKMRPLLSKACRKYFDRLYKTANFTGLGVSVYFRNRNELVKNKEKAINGYLKNKIAYGKLNNILKDMHPVLCVENILNLSKSKKFSGKKFDIINLSNVPNYLTGRSFGLTGEKVVAYLRRLKKLVSAGGTIFFYSYDDSIYPNATSPDIPPISRASFLRKIKQMDTFNVSRKSFPGLVGARDRITLLGC